MACRTGTRRTRYRFCYKRDKGTAVIGSSGIGLDPTSVDQIFASMFTTKPDGMGMGLSISRSIVAAHGGRLWASPRDGFGAIFSIVLRTEPASGPTSGQKPTDI